MLDTRDGFNSGDHGIDMSQGGFLDFLLGFLIQEDTVIILFFLIGYMFLQ